MEIKISSPKFGEQTILIDREDYKIFEEGAWGLFSTERHHSIYVVGQNSKHKYRHKRLHRIIMQAKPGEIIDHINGNALDNRKCNLRITDSHGNNRNARKRKNAKTSKYKGVSKAPRGFKWIGQIQNKGKNFHIIVDTEIQAALWYNKMATELFGEYAVLNIIT